MSVMASAALARGLAASASFASSIEVSAAHRVSVPARGPNAEGRGCEGCILIVSVESAPSQLRAQQISVPVEPLLRLGDAGGVSLPRLSTSHLNSLGIN
jgi:hypothetical protein